MLTNYVWEIFHPLDAELRRSSARSIRLEYFEKAGRSSTNGTMKKYTNNLCTATVQVLGTGDKARLAKYVLQLSLLTINKMKSLLPGQAPTGQVMASAVRQ